MNIGQFCLETQNTAGGSAGMFTDLVSLTLTRERYTPYAVLDFTFEADGPVDTEGMVSVRLVYENTGIFFGRTAGVSMRKSGGRSFITGRAISFTKTLATSDAIPGIMSDCTLRDIVDSNTYMPYVTYQQVSDRASYIYIKESDTIWKAIAALSIKLFEQYPYITGMNNVNIKKAGQAQHSYTNDRITETIRGNNFNNAVSRINMKGTQDTYDFSYEDSVVTGRGIMSERYIPLDRQWLASPTMGLRHRIYFSRRGGIYRGFTYNGFKNEQICDIVSFSHGSISYTGEVSKLVIRADKRGVFTTVISYEDGYAAINA